MDGILHTESTGKICFQYGLNISKFNWLCHVTSKSVYITVYQISTCVRVGGLYRTHWVVIWL